jgi:hypothetical protein
MPTVVETFLNLVDGMHGTDRQSTIGDMDIADFQLIKRDGRWRVLSLSICRSKSGKAQTNAEDDGRVSAEAADLVYHLLVLFQARGVSLDTVLRELEQRTK